MSLIGILADNNYENYLKKDFKEEIDNSQIFFLKEDSIENLKNIKFQTILIVKKINEHKKIIKEIAKKAEYLIVNTDITDNLSFLNDLQVQLITYGFNSKATITASSIDDNKIIVCLQRAITNAHGKQIEPQEFEMDFSNEISSYTAMEITSLLLLYKM